MTRMHSYMNETINQFKNTKKQNSKKPVYFQNNIYKTEVKIP